jgi:hypothetical protein
MASKTEIVNLALLRIGQNTPLVDVDTDDNAVSRAALTLWDIERLKLLRGFRWPFAKKYLVLELVDGDIDDPANTDWVYAYTYPVDCVFARRVLKDEGREDDSPPPFERGRSDDGDPLIFTNQTDAELEYTVDVTDPAEFDPSFVSMLAWKLGEGLALGHSRLENAQKICQEGYAADRAEAQSRGLQEAEYSISSGQADFRVRELFNLALSRIGIARNVVVADPELQFAQLWPRVNFPQERDYVLRCFHWPFATKYATAGLIDGRNVTADRTDRANDDWVYVYRQPSDCLNVRRLTIQGLRQRGHNPPPFDVGRGYAWENDTEETLTLTSVTGWTPDDEITITASADLFADSDVGSAIQLVDGEDVATITITEFVSATEVIGFSDVDVPVSLQETAITTWSLVYDGALIYTDQPDARIAYTARIEDVAAFDPMFRSALAWRLASLLAPSIAQTKNDKAVVQRCEVMYLNDLVRAEAIAANESQKDKPREAEWIQARSGICNDQPPGMTFQDWNRP